MKYGSIIVKENYSLLKGDPNNEPPLNAVPVGLTSLTVMYKVKGYQRVTVEEEWFWVMYGCKNGQCGGVVTISDQAFVNEQIPLSKDTLLSIRERWWPESRGSVSNVTHGRMSRVISRMATMCGN